MTTEWYLYDNVVIGDHVIIGANVQIHPFAIIGKPPASPGSSVHKPKLNDTPTIIQDNAIIGAHVVIYQGCTVGQNTLLGDGVRLRDRVTIGENCIIGMGTKVGPETVICNRVKIMDLCNIAGNMLIEDDVFIAQGTMCANDKYMGRVSVDDLGGFKGPIIRRAATIGMNSTILPGVEIGENAIVGAGSLVVKDVLPRTVVMNPRAHFVRDVREDELK